ncbi:hypothetical protein [Hyphomicrobium sp. LHD-15]|uniref:hypothetical protein n=1 Tax=Hyphomicrobium sp. LHD-15 TaxID=3072142 RepID=UPI00280C9113|nr:hypothetical protein [Hyphomicrobium sp. LHD-15]MDQ8700545.1 hypothetical protein [Hyphomicrobium sp. LHD-15]
MVSKREVILMKLLVPLAALAILVSGGTALAAPLDQKSLAPAWISASQAEKDAWIAAFKFENANADRAGIAQCLDKMAKWEALATNKLSGITSMCETVVAKGGT